MFEIYQTKPIVYTKLNFDYMVKDKSTLTNQVVKEQYEEMISRGLPFLQIFPEMIQESNVAETFRIRAKKLLDLLVG